MATYIADAGINRVRVVTSDGLMWNKIEHRLFSFISQNWRGKPLVSHQVIVNLIAATTTRSGLRVRAAIDPAKYPRGGKVSDKEVDALRIERDQFHGEWNYTLLPRSL